MGNRVTKPSRGAPLACRRPPALEFRADEVLAGAAARVPALGGRMFAGRTLGVAMLATGCLATSAATAQTVDPATSAIARGNFVQQWRQVDGRWHSQRVRTTFKACAYPAVSACGKPVGGPYAPGETIPYNAFGCVRPPITVRCVVEPLDPRPPVTAPARPPIVSPPPARVAPLSSGLWVLKTGEVTAVLDLKVAGPRFSGVSDWNRPGLRRDPIVQGRMVGGTISFTRMCGSRATCLQRFVGRAVGDEIVGHWTGRGASQPIPWTMRRR